MKGKVETIHELTRIEAFLLSEKAGHPSHMHDYFWSQAEAIVRQRAAIVDHARKASREKAARTGKAAPPKAKAATAAAPKQPGKTGEAQLTLVDEPAPAASPKSAVPAKKKAAPSPAKAAPKKSPKSK